MSEVPHDWFDGLFESEWLDYLALGQSPEWTEQTVAFLVEQLDLREGTRVLDLACGRGRVSIPLAQQGCRVTGLDLSPRSLEIARRDAEAAGIELELIHRDMRELDAVAAYDVVLNLFTSFGYFQDDEENERVLQAVARALVPGGAFLIDTLNPITLAPRFKERDWGEYEGGVTLLERHAWQHLRGRVETTWTFVHPDGARNELQFSVRAYTAPELVAMLERQGLDVEGAWGYWTGTELGDGNRIILRVRKPA
jgi:2-polyprenyl-3-methyl-5-hydroxy-6-metoxy-1,4-benzoquinol methylase